MAINATHFQDIPPVPKKKTKHVVHAIIETAKNSPHKYALAGKYGIIQLKEVLPDDMHWPYDYGFVPGTLADDGDPLDLLVITQNGLFSGCFLKVRVVGAIREYKNGVRNDRLIGVPLPSDGAPQAYDAYKDIDDVPKPLLKEIKDFVKTYSQRQGNEVKLGGIMGAKAAMRSVEKTSRAFHRDRRHKKKAAR